MGIGAGLLEGETVSLSWGQYAFDAQNTANASELSAPPDGSGVTEFTGSGPDVVVGTENVYTSTDGVLEAKDRNDLSTVWSWDSGESFMQTPAVVDGVVYVNAGGLYALDSSDGTELWSRTSWQSTSGAPTVDAGEIYLFAYDGSWSLYAIDSSDGSTIWSVQQGNGPTVSLTGDTVFSPADGSSNFYARDRSDGSVVWSLNERADGPTTVADGVVYQLLGTTLTARDASNGDEYWTFANFENGPEAAPVVADGTVYVHERTGGLYAITAGPSGGSEEWSTSGIFKNGASYSDSVVYAAGGGILSAFDASDGSILWDYSASESENTRPVFSGGEMYIRVWSLS